MECLSARSTGLFRRRRSKGRRVDVESEAFGNLTPMNVLAVDPGFANNGWVVMDYHTLELVDSGVEQFVVPADSDEKTTARIVTWMRRIQESYKPAMFLVEFQGCSMTLRGVEMALLACAQSLGISSKVVYPLTIKSHFASRGLSCRGNKKNKEDAVLLVHQLGYPTVVSHVADSILMCIYLRECANTSTA